MDDNIRSLFPILSIKVEGNPLVYLDNAATTQKPQVVIDRLVKYYSSENANIHRGIHYLSELATSEYEKSKKTVGDFISSPANQIIYTKNTTESLNLVAYGYGLSNLKKGDVIVTTEMEHHSNIVPWQLIEKYTGAKLKYVKVNDDFSLDLEDLKKILGEGNVKIVTVVQSSNVTGIFNPVKEITDLAHENGAIVIVDAAQSAPSNKIDVNEMDVDFLAFSSHKMCGPTGIGILYAKAKLLEEMTPFLGGGDMIETVTKEKSTWNILPYKFEAGTPNIADAIAFGRAIEFLNELGMDNIHKKVLALTEYALKKMSAIEGIEIFGQKEIGQNRGSAVAFTAKFAHPHDIAQILNDSGIAIRAGNHCAQVLHTRFGVSSSSRASFYFYNTFEEIDFLCEKINEIKKVFS